MNNGAGVLSKSSVSVSPVAGEHTELVNENDDGAEARLTEPGPMGSAAPVALPPGEVSSSAPELVEVSDRAVSNEKESAASSEYGDDPIAFQQVVTERIRAANLDFLRRVNDAMSLPIQVLLAQRDTALAEIAETEKRARAERQRAHAEHERFISYLMEEQLMNLRHVREQLDAAKEELQRARALAAPRVAGVALAREASLSRKAAPVAGGAAPSQEVADEAAELRHAADESTFASFSDGLRADAATEGGPESALEQALQQIDKLRDELQAAFTEIDETRAEAARLQEERDEAIRATDDVRVELQAAIDAARDETFEVQTKLDELARQLDDARDEGRDEALRLNEVIDDTQRQLDERNEEVRRLRARIEDGVDEVQHSRPPPPGPASELEAARREVKWLRQQLIVAKRQISSVGAERAGTRVRTTKTTRESGSDLNDDAAKPRVGAGLPSSSGKNVQAKQSTGLGEEPVGESARGARFTDETASTEPKEADAAADSR